LRAVDLLNNIAQMNTDTDSMQRSGSRPALRSTMPFWTSMAQRTVRAMRRQCFFLQVTYDTPRKKVEGLIAGIRRFMIESFLINKTNFQVHLWGLIVSKSKAQIEISKHAHQKLA
jgi:hypothetical protein